VGRHVDNGEGSECGMVGIYRQSFCLPLNFAVNLKLLSKVIENNGSGVSLVRKEEEH